MVFHTHKLGLASAGLVYTLIFYSDYVLVYYVIEYGMQRSTGKTFQAILAHFLTGMAVLSHIRAMFSDPGYVPLPQTKIDFSSDLEKKDSKSKKRKLPAIDEWSVCRVCETYRPPRTHHCRKCGRCVRRMDHHCPWTNNCVGELNFKYFYLLLVYVGLFCCYGIILIVCDWRWDSYRDTTDRVLTLILFFIVVIFGMFASAVSFGQTFAVICDRNALEVHRYGAPTKFPKTSFLVLATAMCGRGSKFLWLLPCVSPHIPKPVPPSKYSKLSNDSNSVYNV